MYRLMSAHQLFSLVNKKNIYITQAARIQSNFCVSILVLEKRSVTMAYYCLGVDAINQHGLA